MEIDNFVERFGSDIEERMKMAGLCRRRQLSRTILKLSRFSLRKDDDDTEHVIELVRLVITSAAEAMFHGRLKVWYDLTALGRSLERIGGLRTNIAENAIFMFSGEIVRHDFAYSLEPLSEVDG